MVKHKLESLEDLSSFINFSSTRKENGKPVENPVDETKEVKVAAASPEEPVGEISTKERLSPVVVKDKKIPEKEIKLSQDELDKKMFEDALKHEEEDTESGPIITGRVIGIRENDVVVDIGRKSDGTVPLDEFIIHSNKKIKAGEKEKLYKETVKVGDNIPVSVLRGGTSDGAMRLSYRKAKAMIGWLNVKKAMKESSPIDGKVLGMTKGGFDIYIGFVAFCPLSHISLAKKKKPGRFFGKTYSFKVVEADRRRMNVVLSRRLLLEEEKQKLRDKTLSLVKEGDVLEGTVKSLTDFGAFVDIGGIDGLVHISDISWARNIKHPSDILTIGQTVKVKVIQFDREKNKIKLGIKQIAPDPWDHVEDKYPDNTIVEGVVTHLTNFGAFVEVEPGVEGLIHISELSWKQHIDHPDEILSEGDVVKAQVLSCNPAEKRISLGLKQITPDPWALTVEHFKVGDRTDGKVVKIMNDCIVVRLDDNIDGIVHKEDISWSDDIKQPSKYVSVGDHVEAVILKIEPAKRMISLGLKQITEDPWLRYVKKYQKGTVVEGKVVRITPFGAFVQIEEGLDGLVHISQLSTKKVARVEDVLQLNQIIKLKVIRIDPREHKINLSVREYLEGVEREDLNKYLADESSSRVTLADLINMNKNKSQ